MTKADYLKAIKGCKEKADRITKIEKAYKVILEDSVKKVISYADEIDFFDEERRALMYKEICDPKKYLHYDFIAHKLIPLIDAYDNTYIVYVIEEKKWAKCNIIDGSLFKKKASLDAVL